MDSAMEYIKKGDKKGKKGKKKLKEYNYPQYKGESAIPKDRRK